MDSTRKTVREVVKLYQESGWKGLKDGRCGPNKPHNKIGPSWEDKIRTEYQEGPIKTLTSFRTVFNRIYDTTFSYAVFRRVTKDLRPSKKRKKKHKKKSILREKYSKEALLRWQADIKYLTDIEHFIPQMIEMDLPRYQIGFRDVVSGSTLWFYTYELTKSVMQNAVATFLANLRKWDIPTDKLEIQTDNDTTIVDHGIKRNDFTRIVEDVYQADHTQIPPGACWLQGYIESFHNTCEQMFYAVEDYKSVKHFIEKAYTWQLTYNLIRPMEGLENRTPYEVAKEKYSHLTAKFYTELPPVIYKGDESAPRLEEHNSSGYLLAKKVRK